MPYQGSCHCGALTYAYETALPPQEWPIRACQCSFCRAHGARSTSDPRGAVQFHVRQPDRLKRYRFGQRITEFLICAECGVYMGAVTEISGSLYAIINTNTLRPRPEGLKAPAAADYEGESVGMRNERRRSRWTPCTAITGGAQG
jgi:hypothetical protein